MRVVVEDQTNMVRQLSTLHVHTRLLDATRPDMSAPDTTLVARADEMQQQLDATHSYFRFSEVGLRAWRT